MTKKINWGPSNDIIPSEIEGGIQPSDLLFANVRDVFRPLVFLGLAIALVADTIKNKIFPSKNGFGTTSLTNFHSMDDDTPFNL